MFSKTNVYNNFNAPAMIPEPYIFILLGNRFEETIVTIFATKLRKAGLRVKVIGLKGLRMTGNHGLKFSADITLGQALSLADHAACVVLPYSSRDAKHVTNDLRVQNFFDRARMQNALFVIGQSNRSELESIHLPVDQTLICPDDEQLIGLVGEIATSLSNRA